MPRLAVALFVLTILSSACQPSARSEPATTTGTEPIPSTTSPRLPEVSDVTSSTVPEPERAPDHFVVSTADGSVIVRDTSGAEISQFDPGAGSIYRQPTWLDRETIVFSEVASSGANALIAADAGTGAIVWRAGMETSPFYFSPAPSGSPYASTSLRSDPTGIGLIAELIDHEGIVESLSDESPFYTAWSPEGDSLAIHIAGQHLDVRTMAGVETISTETGLFQTPVWLERGLVTIRTVDETARLSIWSEGLFEDIAEVEGPVGFVAVNDMVAIQAAERPDPGSIAVGLRTQTLPTIPDGRLVVIDLRAGVTHTVSSEPALFYQWDQAGEELLYATLDDEPFSVTWHVWASGESREISSFTLQPLWLQALVPFFDQYAQSVLLWSGSGEYIAYPAVDDGGPAVIIEPVDGSDPEIIPEATWVAWAPSG